MIGRADEEKGWSPSMGFVQEQVSDVPSLMFPVVTVYETVKESLSAV